MAETKESREKLHSDAVCWAPLENLSASHGSP